MKRERNGTGHGTVFSLVQKNILTAFTPTTNFPLQLNSYKFKKIDINFKKKKKKKKKK